MNTLDRRTVEIGVGALGLWIALAVGLSITRVPWSSEAWFAIPAINLSEHGYMGTSVLASRGTWLRGLERHTYWIMPAHALAQAVWYKAIGFSLLRQRLLSVAFGIVALLSWFVIIASLSKTYLAALIGGLVIGFQRDFLNAAANGRMDMMTAALGSMAIAIWLKFHSISPRAAVLVSHSLAAAAVFTHPCGVLFAGVLVISNLYVERKVRLSTFALVAAPYLSRQLFGGSTSLKPRPISCPSSLAMCPALPENTCLERDSTGLRLLGQRLLPRCGCAT